jgi:hypothetical protein
MTAPTYTMQTDKSVTKPVTSPQGQLKSMEKPETQTKDDESIDRNLQLVCKTLPECKQAFRTMNALANQQTQAIFELNKQIRAQEESLKKADELMRKQSDLLDRQQHFSDKTADDALAAGIALGEVSGTWTIRGQTFQLVCNVQPYYNTRTLQISNCH